MDLRSHASITDSNIDISLVGGLGQMPPFRGRTPVRWLPEEDEKLKQALSLHESSNPNWREVAALVGTKNPTQCSRRWKRALQPDLKKGRWCRDEDDRLIELIHRLNFQWKDIARHMDGRSSKQCRERWCNYLNPNLRRGPWTPDEDQIILKTHAQIGNRWSELSSLLPGRTENSVKLRWKSLTRPRKYPPRLSMELPTLSIKSAGDALDDFINVDSSVYIEDHLNIINDSLSKLHKVDEVNFQSDASLVVHSIKKARVMRSESEEWMIDFELLNESKETIESWNVESNTMLEDQTMKNAVSTSNSFICALYETSIQCWQKGDHLSIGTFRQVKR